MHSTQDFDAHFGHPLGVKIFLSPSGTRRWWSAALSAPAPDVRSPAHFVQAGLIYFSLTLGRFFVYFLHVTGAF